MDQSTLWHAVNASKHNVRQAIGAQLSHEFRSTAVYQGYTGLCGEAAMAYQEGELDAELVARRNDIIRARPLLDSREGAGR